MTMQNGNPGFNIWAETLQEFEPYQYYSSPTGTTFGQRSPRRRRYFSNAYEDILKDWFGVTGTSMRSGEQPMSFMDYLETDPWTKRYSSLPQAARGVTGTAANPRTRFLYNF